MQRNPPSLTTKPSLINWSEWQILTEHLTRYSPAKVSAFEQTFRRLMNCNSSCSAADCLEVIVRHLPYSFHGAQQYRSEPIASRDVPDPSLYHEPGPISDPVSKSNRIRIIRVTRERNNSNLRRSRQAHPAKGEFRNYDKAARGIKTTSLSKRHRRISG
jgi:hypothetical protein